MKWWPWSLPAREDVAERVERAKEVRAEAKCLVEKIQRVIEMAQGALGEEVGNDDGGLWGGGTPQDQRGSGEAGG